MKNELLEKDIRSLELLVEKNVILGIDYILPLFTMVGGLLGDGILLSERGEIGKRQIIPSLSISFYEKGDAECIKDSDGLKYAFMQFDIAIPEQEYFRSSDYFYKNTCGETIFVKCYIDYYTILILKKPLSDDFNFLRIARLNYFIRQKSLNFLNESSDLTGRLVRRFAKVATPKIDDSICKIINLIKEVCNCEVGFFEKHHEFGINDFSLIERWRVGVGFKLDEKAIVFFDNVLNAHLSDLKQHKKPIIGISGEIVYLFVPVLSKYQNISFRYIICLSSEFAIPPYVISDIYEMMRFYFDVFLEKKKTHLLDMLYQVSMFKAHEYPWTNFKTIIQMPVCILNKIESCFNDLLSVTNAFSGTMRLFCPKNRSLFRIIGVSLSNVSRTVSEDDSLEIPITGSSSSVNVSTFLNKKKYDYSYLPDLGRLRRRKYSGFVDHRINAFSELCLPVFFFDVCVGVVNFESDQINGLKKDIDYIKSFVVGLGEVFENSYLHNDKEWLAQRSQVHQNLHELKAVISDKRIPSEIRERLGWYIWSSPNNKKEKETLPLSKLSDFLDDYIKDFEIEQSVVPWLSITEELVNDFRSGCKIWLSTPSLQIKETDMSMLMVIYKNMLNNYRKHSDKERDGLWVYQSKDSSEIIFKMRSSKLLGDGDLNDLFIRPIVNRNEDDYKIRYGFFIVGMLARHLEGIAFAYNLENEYKSEFIVKIPLLIQR